VRFWGFVTLGALLALIASSAWPGEPRRYLPVTPNEQLAREALRGFTRTPNETIAQQVLDAAHERLRAAAQVSPDALQAADVLLRRGYNSGEVEALLTRHSLGFASVEAKTPVSDGTVMTLWSRQYGPPPNLPGTIAEQVDRLLGRQRMQFLRNSQLLGDTDQARRLREIGLSRELGVYRVEVWGRQEALLALLDEPDVRGVIAESNGLRAASYEKARDEMEAQPIIRGPTTRIVIPDDPSVPLPPLPPDIYEAKPLPASPEAGTPR